MARILVVDDSVAVLEGFEMFLSGLGHQVTLSTSGEDALEILRHQPIDLVLTDLYMPYLDGLELIRSIHEFWPERPVIAISGMTGTVDMLPMAEHMGACCSLKKPFSSMQLLQALKFALCILRDREHRFEFTTAFPGSTYPLPTDNCKDSHVN